MRSVVGVQVVAGGTVEVLGRPAGSPQLRRAVGYVTQAPSVYADLTVRENLRYFAAVLGPPRATSTGCSRRRADRPRRLAVQPAPGAAEGAVSLAAAC